MYTFGTLWGTWGIIVARYCARNILHIWDNFSEDWSTSALGARPLMANRHVAISRCFSFSPLINNYLGIARQSLNQSEASFGMPKNFSEPLCQIASEHHMGDFVSRYQESPWGRSPTGPTGAGMMLEVFFDLILPQSQLSNSHLKTLV